MRYQEIYGSEKKVRLGSGRISNGDEHIRRTFDFLAKKEEKYYGVEMKMNRAQLRDLAMPLSRYAIVLKNLPLRIYFNSCLTIKEE